MGEQGVQKNAPLRASMLRISGVEMLFPTFTTWGRPIRKSRIQLNRAGFRPRASSLIMSLEGTMVLNAELKLMNSILTWVFQMG